MQTSQSINDQTAHISLQISRNVKKQGKQNNQNRAISFVAPSKPSTSRFFRPVPEAGDLSSSSASNRQDIISTFFSSPPLPGRPIQRRRLGERVSRPHRSRPQAKKEGKLRKTYNALKFMGLFRGRDAAPALFADRRRGSSPSRNRARRTPEPRNSQQTQGKKRQNH